MFNLNTSTCLFFVLAVFNTGCTATSHWTYNEDEWPQQCKEGSKQSPIALSHEIAEEEDFSSLIFEQYDKTYPVQSKNNGHSIEIRLHVQSQPLVRGGGLPHFYILDHLHFHWESEHVIDDERFPLELHLVHYAQQFGNLSQALKHTGGVAVFSVLFYISPDSDKQFDPLVSVIEKVKDQVNLVQEMYIKIDDFLPRDRAGFYRYNGSLTTPDCTEGLIWTVFTNKLPISKDQVAAFPLMKSEDNVQVLKNYRSLQKLNGRRILMRSSPIDSSSSSKNVSLTCIIVMFLLVFVRNS